MFMFFTYISYTSTMMNCKSSSYTPHFCSFFRFLPFLALAFISLISLNCCKSAFYYKHQPAQLKSAYPPVFHPLSPPS